METLGLPYIEPSFGKRALPLDRERSRKDAVQFLTSGRRILPGWGKHRLSPYEHFRYQVSEAA